MMNETTKETLGKLEYPGDSCTIDLADGSVVRFRVESDPDATINDYESDGRYAWAKDSRSGRPVGFTGRARKLQIGGDSVWWEPPGVDITGQPWDKETTDEEASRIRDLIESGFIGLVAELGNGEDAYGDMIVTDVASLWGIGSLGSGYAVDVAEDLASELGVTL